MTEISADAPPVLIGELILDTFPSGEGVWGGAPFIVSWHLQGLGASPHLISRVGADLEGQQIRQRMQAWGMSTAGIQIDPDHPTGQVRVTLVQGQPQFEILPEQAYDFIAVPPALEICRAHTPSMLYHGTLATRIPAARQALLELYHSTQLPIFLDLNLRDPWWDREWVQQCLDRARWLKVNQSELAVIFEQPQIPLDQVGEYVEVLQTRQKYELLIVTLGEEGAILADSEQILQLTAPRLDCVTDTVGAGDAFSAIAILGLQRGWSLEQILKRGLLFAADICQIPGGTTTNLQLYDRHLQSWARADRAR